MTQPSSLIEHARSLKPQQQAHLCFSRVFDFGFSLLFSKEKDMRGMGQDFPVLADPGKWRQVYSWVCRRSEAHLRKRLPAYQLDE